MKSPLPALSLLLAAPLWTAAPGEAVAQELAAVVPASREDSIRAHRFARSRQAAFERTRRNHLPRTWGGGSGECDERIGRFCLTYSDENAPEWEPPEEPGAIVRARERLLDELAATTATIPGDRWVVGHRVRYLVEAERYDDARAAAASCRAERWWCDALRGYAAHHAGAAGAADSAYSRMLASMPEETREEWTDLSVILASTTLRTYRRLGGAERRAFEERFWMLADPLVQTGGNDLRSEHFSRNLLVELQDKAESPENLPWGDDLREILIRFGAPSGWERIRRSPAHLHTQELSLVSHYPSADLDLLPPPELLDGEFDPAAGVWGEENRRSRASYPLLRGGDRLRWFTPFEHQVAVLRQGDSARVVVAYSVPADSLENPGAVDAALSARASLESDLLVTRRPGAGPSAILTIAAPQGPLLVSLEAFSAAEYRAGRARFGLDIPPLVPGVLATSDLLLLDLQEDTVAESREEALRLARGSVRVAPGERIGVYWEMYSPGVPWPESLEVSLRLVDADAGWWRRLAERVGVVAQIQPIRLVWDETVQGEETIPRSLTLSMPTDIDAGEYTLELTVAAPGREPVIARRTIRVDP